MQFFTMDTLLTDIYNIRNITFIEIRELSMLQSESKEIIIPLLTIAYDGGKSLSLCSRDKYFNTFVKKVVQVYNDEKNNIMEDSLTDPFRLRTKIKIDERTKTILDSGKLESVSELYQFYDDKESYDTSLLLNVDEVRTLMKVVNYHLCELFSNTDKNICFSDEFTGYKNRYIFNGKIDNLEMQFPVSYEKISDNKYLFCIGNLIDSNYPVKVFISFEKDRIIVECLIEEYELISNFTYLITDGLVKRIVETRRSGVLISYVNTNLEECENELLGITNFDSEHNFKWFRLPWNAYYGINSIVSDLSKSEKNIEIANMYLYGEDSFFVRREYYSKVYKKEHSSLVKIDEVCLDEAIKNTIGVCLSQLDNVYLIETLFLDTRNANGYYEEKMKNRYFYHVVKSDEGIINFDKDKLITISHGDSILETSDLFNSSLVMKRINRGGRL